LKKWFHASLTPILSVFDVIHSYLTEKMQSHLGPSSIFNVGIQSTVFFLTTTVLLFTTLDLQPLKTGAPSLSSDHHFSFPVSLWP
jgi:hypothetical protein